LKKQNREGNTNGNPREHKKKHFKPIGDFLAKHMRLARRFQMKMQSHQRNNYI